jgi:hypothetical protein
MWIPTVKEDVSEFKCGWEDCDNRNVYIGGDRYGFMLL